MEAQEKASDLIRSLRLSDAFGLGSEPRSGR